MAEKNVNYRALGERIQQRRKQLGLTQNDASEKLDLSTSFFSRVERGEKVASLETIIKVANYFEFSLDLLFQDSIKRGVTDKLQGELTQIFAGKTSEEAERLLAWLKMLSENIDKLP